MSQTDQQRQDSLVILSIVLTTLSSKSLMQIMTFYCDAQSKDR